MLELTSAARPRNGGRILFYGTAVLAVLCLPGAMRYRALFYPRDSAEPCRNHEPVRRLRPVLSMRRCATCARRTVDPESTG